MTGTEEGISAAIPRGRIIAGAAIIVIAVILMYSPVIHHEFVYDDFILVAKNPDIKDISPAGIRHIFFGRDYQNYLPLRMLVYAVVYHFAGDNPVPFHLLNILLHAINSILVFFIAGALAIRAGPETASRRFSFAVSLCAGLLFAVHPLHIESVTWISGLKELLSSFFCLCAMLVYIRFRSKGMSFGFPLIIIFFIAALLSKATSLFLPFAFILFDLVFPDDARRTPVLNRMLEHGLLLLIAAGFTVLNYTLAADKQMITMPVGGSNAAHMATILKIIPFYMKMAVWPWPMSVIYDIPASGSLIDPGVLISIGAMILLGAAFFRFLITSPPSAFAVAFFVLAFGPTLNVVPFGILAADRYAYLPLFGFCAAVSLLFARLLDTGRIARAAAWVCLAVAIALCFRAGSLRNSDWKNPVSLWEATVKTSPDSAKAQMSLGIAYLDVDRLEDARKHLEISKELNPYFTKAFVGLSMYYRKKGNLSEAFNVLKEGLNYSPEELELHYNIGIVYFDQKAYSSTARIMTMVMSEYPNYKQSVEYFRESMAYLQENLPPEDFERFRRTLSSPGETAKKLNSGR